MKRSAKTSPDHDKHFPMLDDCLNRRWHKMPAKIPLQYQCRPDPRRMMLELLVLWCLPFQCRNLFVAVGQDHPGINEIDENNMQSFS